MAGVCFHILKYDTTINDYVRVWAGGWQFCNIENGGLYVFDISKFNDGSRFAVCAIQTASGARYLMNLVYEYMLVGYKTGVVSTNLDVTDELMGRINLTIV